MLAPLGAIAVAAFRALNVVSDLTFVVPSPLQSATQTVIGQRLGARDLDGRALVLRARAARRARRHDAHRRARRGSCAWPLAYVFTLERGGRDRWPRCRSRCTWSRCRSKAGRWLSLAPIRASGDTRFSMIVGILVQRARAFRSPGSASSGCTSGSTASRLGWIVAWTVRALLTQWKLRDGAWMRRAPLAA